MAEILLAIDCRPSSPKRFVIVKRIRPEFAQDPDYIDFFINEGIISRLCKHQNIPEAQALEWCDGSPYLVMEYIRGHTLQRVMKACRDQSTFLSIPGIVRIATTLASALSHLHTLKDANADPLCVIHRDVSPPNILIDGLGRTFLLDLGLARSAAQLHATKSGQVKGRASYCSPEQLISSSQRQVDQKTDIFSLGIILYELLTNAPLFKGETNTETFKKVAHLKIPAIRQRRSDCPLELETLVMAMLQRDPAKRIESAQALLERLRSFVAMAYSAIKEEWKDEVLQLCGDPPVPTLGAEALEVLRKSLRNT